MLLAASKVPHLNLHVTPWVWAVVGGIVATLLALDILVVHRKAHEVGLRRAALETAIWLLIGVSFGVFVLANYGGDAGSQWFAGYLIELSLSIDNVFVWALILTYYAVPRAYQHRVLFWGIFGAVALRAAFVFAGVALLNRFEWILFLFGGFLLYTAVKLVVKGDDDAADPSSSRFLRIVHRIVPSTPDYDGQRLFTHVSGRRLATPLLAVLVLIETTDVLFAVDSVPAVLAVSRDQFIVLTSNAFAILGLRALYFLLADLHARFSHLQQGLAIILAFVGVKMIVSHWVHIATWISLVVIVVVLTLSILASLAEKPTGAPHASASDEEPPPFSER